MRIFLALVLSISTSLLYSQRPNKINANNVEQKLLNYFAKDYISDLELEGKKLYFSGKTDVEQTSNTVTVEKMAFLAKSVERRDVKLLNQRTVERKDLDISQLTDAKINLKTKNPDDWELKIQKGLEMAGQFYLKVFVCNSYKCFEYYFMYDKDGNVRSMSYEYEL